MQVKELTLEKRIRILEPGTLGSEYKNKVFVLDPNDEGQFIDWLNGSILFGFTRSVADAGQIEPLTDAYSFKGWNQLAKDDITAYVRTMLLARIYTQRGELVYPQENTSGTGCPPLYKKRQQEVDLILKNIILDTPGVVRIREFISTVVNRAYTAETVIECQGGETLWQTIAI